MIEMIIGCNVRTIKKISDFTGTTRQNVKKMLEQLDIKKYIKIKKTYDILPFTQNF